MSKFGINGGHFYSNVAAPVQVDINVIVDASNGNGLGVRSLKSNGMVSAMFMHTSATPGSQSGLLNPNPAVGFAEIHMKQNIGRLLGCKAGFVCPVATSTKIDNAALTPGQVYVIGTLGSATVAQWRKVGVPAGVTPAVGVAFTAIAAQSDAGNTVTSRVFLPTKSAVVTIEGVGNSAVQSTTDSKFGGQILFLQFLDATGAPIAPAAGSVLVASLVFDGSSVTIDGQ